MLVKWILFQQQLLKLQNWLQISKYSTQRETIEMILRSEIRGYTVEGASKMLQKNRFLLGIPPNELRKSFRTLKKLRFENSDVITHPQLLIQTDYELINNFQRLLEVGFHEVTAYRLANIKEIMSQSVHFNQCFNFMPVKPNIVQNIYSVAMVSTESIHQISYNLDTKLGTVHRLALEKYMVNRIGYSTKDIDEIWFNYSTVKSRSLQSIDQTTRLLEKIYKMPMKNLPKSSLTMYPEQIEELLRIDVVCGVDVRKIMMLCAKCNADRLQKIRKICQSYNIPDYALAYAPKIFFLNYDTLQSRLNVISKFKRANEFLRHVAIGRVILGLDRIQTYLKTEHSNVDAVFNETFIDFYLNGSLFTSSCPLLFYLCAEFKKTNDEIKNALQFHPHLKRYSFPIVYENIKYLLQKKFTHEDIFKHLHVILYASAEIKEFFRLLKTPSKMKQLNIDPSKLTKSQMLRLCVYLIEKKSNFNGDGVFIGSHTVEFDDAYYLKMEQIVKKFK